MDTLCPLWSMFHVFAGGTPFVALMLGMRIVFTNQFMQGEDLVQIFADTDVTFTHGVPTIWQSVRVALEKTHKDMRLPFNVKRIVCGGAAPPMDLIQWFEGEYGVEFMQS